MTSPEHPPRRDPQQVDGPTERLSARRPTAPGETTVRITRGQQPRFPRTPGVVESTTAIIARGARTTPTEAITTSPATEQIPTRDGDGDSTAAEMLVTDGNVPDSAPFGPSLHLRDGVPAYTEFSPFGLSSSDRDTVTDEGDEDAQPDISESPRASRELMKLDRATEILDRLVENPVDDYDGDVDSFGDASFGDIIEATKAVTHHVVNKVGIDRRSETEVAADKAMGDGRTLRLRVTNDLIVVGVVDAEDPDLIEPWGSVPLSEKARVRAGFINQTVDGDNPHLILPADQAKATLTSIRTTAANLLLWEDLPQGVQSSDLPTERKQRK